MRLLAITHTPTTDLGVFRDVIKESGMVFGGPMHTHDQEQHPWIRDEATFLRGLVERQIPTLGVCFGAQLLVQTIGGSVFGAPEAEKGWTTVELTEAAEDDPLIGTLPRRFLAFNWHVDTWTLPRSGAVELARSERCPQAHRIGRCAWGVQFHPEVNRSIAHSWVERAASDYVDIDAMWRDIDAHMDVWNALGKSLCATFVDVASTQAHARQ